MYPQAWFLTSHLSYVTNDTDAVQGNHVSPWLQQHSGGSRATSTFKFIAFPSSTHINWKAPIHSVWYIKPFFTILSTIRGAFFARRSSSKLWRALILKTKCPQSPHSVCTLKQSCFIHVHFLSPPLSCSLLLSSPGCPIPSLRPGVQTAVSSRPLLPPSLQHPPSAPNPPNLI